MRSRWMVAVTTLPLLITPSAALARTWHIAADGSGDAPTLQAGIDSAGANDTVLVASGTYIENINFLGTSIVVKSEFGPDATILDGSGSNDSVVLMIADEDSGAVLDGFTITGGTGHMTAPGQFRGGGIFIAARSPIIRHNHFLGNVASAYGGAVYIGSASDLSIPVAPKLESNVFEHNEADFGGAIASFWGDPIISGNTFVGNNCDYDGGAVFIWTRSGYPQICRNEFLENVALDHGGAILASDRDGQAQGINISYNLFIRNRAEGRDTGDTGSGGAIWLSFSGHFINNTLVNNFGFGESVCSGGGLLLEDSPVDLEVKDNIIAYNNSCGIVCELAVQTPAARNLFWMNVNGDFGIDSRYCGSQWADEALVTDPLFCDAASDNYTLASNSPALGMGAFPGPQCPPVAIRASTWGRIKQMYKH